MMSRILMIYSLLVACQIEPQPEAEVKLGTSRQKQQDPVAAEARHALVHFQSKPDAEGYVQDFVAVVNLGFDVDSKLENVSMINVSTLHLGDIPQTTIRQYGGKKELGDKVAELLAGKQLDPSVPVDQLIEIDEFSKRSGTIRDKDGNLLAETKIYRGDIFENAVSRYAISFKQFNDGMEFYMGKIRHVKKAHTYIANNILKSGINSVHSFTEFKKPGDDDNIDYYPTKVIAIDADDWEVLARIHHDKFNAHRSPSGTAFGGNQ